MINSKILDKAQGLPREELELEYLRLVRENEYFRKQIFGQKSERHVAPEIADQLKLELGEIGPSQDPPEMEEVTYQRKKSKKNPAHPGRHPLPDHLPRKEIVIEPEEDVSGMQKMGEEITETLDYTPPKFFVNRYIRPSYGMPEGEGVITAPMPSRPIDKGIAEAGLLAIILIDKYLDHLPLYRQVQRFKRLDIRIADSTINDWVAQVCTLLAPLYEAHRKEVLTQWYLQVDETTIKVLDRLKPKNKHLGYHWVYHAPRKKLVLFDYQRTRKKEEPLKCLQNYQGYLQTDGYAAYDQFGKKKGIVMLACMAHARRKFFEAGQKDPRVVHALGVFRQLYAIERKARETQLNPEERKALRIQEAKPIWDGFKLWLIETWKELTPKHHLSGAIEYTLSRWKELGGYILHGELEIDNNLIENSIRPVALGRKNYLFAGSHNGAQRAAMIYSLLGTCKMHQVEPFAWLKHCLEKLPDHPVNRVHELLPQNWKPQP